MPAHRKRSSELQRPRSRKGAEERNVTKGRQRGQRWYTADPDWSEEIKALWNAAKASGGADFYEQSDIAFLKILLSDLDRARKQRLSGQLLTALYAQLNNFLLTETDRRKARIELEGEPEEVEDPPEVAIMNDYRKALDNK